MPRRFARQNVVKTACGYVISFRLQTISGLGYLIGLKEIHLGINRLDLLEGVFGRAIRMSTANKFNRMKTARTGSCLLVAILINCISPLVLRAYEVRFRGQPTIPLTEFVLYRLPHVLLLLSFGMLVGSFCIRRCAVKWRSTFENFLTCLVVIGCILYLFGIMLPFITYQIGLN